MERSEAGPLLNGVLSAQLLDEQVTAYPSLLRYADALTALSDELGGPIICPVGAAAERLAGAAVLASSGRVRLAGWSDTLARERVLVTTVAAVTPIALLSAAERAIRLGAREVHAAFVALDDLNRPTTGPIRTWHILHPTQTLAVSAAH